MWLVLGAGVVAGGGFAVQRWGFSRAAVDEVLTAVTTRGELVVTVTERGELESAQAVQVVCEIEGGGKLVTIVPEGTRVAQGDEVARFDTDALLKSINEQEVRCQQASGRVKVAESELEVQKNKAESEIAKAELALTLAQMDYDSYEEGEYTVELEKRKGTLELAKKELKEAEDNLAFTHGLVKKGFAQLEQLRVMELNLEGKRYTVSQQEADLRVLEKFTKIRRMTELKAKAEDAARELERTKKSQAAATDKAENELAAARRTEELENERLKRYNAQLEKCIVRAPQDGIVIYYSRPWDEESRIRPGGTLHYQQPIFTLPDLDKMQVQLKVHESVVKKIQEGQTATMQVDALPKHILHGKVKTVATMAKSDNWRTGGVKEYETKVSIDDLPKDAGLRPGMTAEVKILVKTIPEALIVPVQAVTELDGQHVAYVVTRGGIERRGVEVGESNEQLIQILRGLREGEQVALDARSRAAAELKSNENQEAAPEEKSPAKEESPAAENPPPAVARAS